MLYLCTMALYTAHLLSSFVTPEWNPEKTHGTKSRRLLKSTTVTTTLKISSTVTRRENLSRKKSTDNDSSAASIIHFPSSSSVENPGNTGDNCVTFYGQLGTCQPTYNCFQQRTLFQTQMLLHCGFVHSTPLICCPDEALGNREQKPQNKINTEQVPFQFPSITDEPTRKTGPTVVPPPPPPPPQTDTPHPAQTDTPPVPRVPPNPSEIPKHESSLPASWNHPMLDVKQSTKNIGIQPNTFRIPLTQDTCGIYNSSDLSKDDTWPWIVSIGHRNADGSIKFSCFGSLITREYIITSGLCVQQDPNVILLGIPFLGTMSQSDSSAQELRPINQILIHQKFISPYPYKNVGLLQISPIIVSFTLMPICFPFVASVLDIIHFRGYMAKTLGFEFPVDKATGIRFQREEYRILGNEQCSRIFDNKKSETIDSFPYGIRTDNICGIKVAPTSICAVPGAPLVLYDEASSSNVQIGIALGDPTCGKFNRQLVTFTRMNSFSTWVRERVAVFPSPPPCYF